MSKLARCGEVGTRCFLLGDSNMDLVGLGGGVDALSVPTFTWVSAKSGACVRSKLLVGRSLGLSLELSLLSSNTNTHVRGTDDVSTLCEMNDAVKARCFVGDAADTD